MSRKLVSVSLTISTTLWLAGSAVVPLAFATHPAVEGQVYSHAAAAAFAPSRSLFLGVRGDDVKALQEYLNAAGYPVAASGPGSPGNETTYYGSLTRAAVAKWQAANAVAPAVGYFGPLSRAKYNAIVGGVVTPPPVAGGLAVSVDPALAGSTVVADSTANDGAQALAEVARFRFSGNGRVTQLKLHRIGISNDADFSNVYLYDGNLRLAEAPAVASGYFTFTNSAGLFDVAGTRVISMKVDIANNASVAGKTFQFGIMAASDVVSNAVQVSGAFPFHGPEFRMANIGDLGKLKLVNESPSVDTTVDPGVNNYEVWRFRGESNDQKIQVSYLKFSMVGTADYDAIQNLKLYVDGVQVGNTVALMNTDKSAVIDLAAAPVEFTVGTIKTFALRGDIVKGSGRNFYFQLTNSSDIVAKDAGYGVLIKVNPGLGNVPDVWSIFKPPANVEVTVNSGSLTIQKSSDSPTGPFADGATNLELARFDFKAVGEDIKVSQITVKVDSSDNAVDMKNLKVTLDGVQIGTTASTLADNTNQTYNAGNSFIVPAGVTKKLSMWADLTDADVTDGDTLTMTLVAGSGNALRMSAGTSFDAPASNQSTAALSVAAGTLGTTKNGAVANVNTVVGAGNVLIGSWLITAPSEQGVRVSSVTINDNGNSVGLGDAFDAMVLKSGGVQYGQTINSPSATAATAQIFSFSTALEIPAGQSKQIDLYANVLTSATTAAWAGAGDDAVKVTTVNTTGIVTNSAVNFSGNVVGQLLTINTGATLTMANEASPTMPDSAYLVAGDLGQTLAAWKFSANNTEDVKVTRVKVFEVGDIAAATASDNPGNLKNVKLYVDGVQVGATVPAFTVSTATSGIDAATLDNVLFEDANGLFTVPKNSSKTLVFKADITDNTNASFNADGATAKARLEITDGAATATTNVSAKGVTSGALVTLESGASATNALNSSDMRVVKTKPVFSLVAPGSTVLVSGAEQEFLRFRIAANAAEDVKFVSGTHNIRLTFTGSIAAASMSSYKLVDVASGVTLATIATGAATVDFTTYAPDITVAKGTSKEFYILATSASGIATGNSVKLSIKNAAADLSWSDSTASADIEDLNYVGFGLPLEGATFSK